MEQDQKERALKLEEEKEVVKPFFLFGFQKEDNMELKIKITVPKGYATSSNKDFFEMRMIKKLMFSKAKIKEEYTNVDGSEMFWVVEVNARNYITVTKNVYMYSNIVTGVFDNKHAKKALKRLSDSPEDYEKVTEMMKDGTKIEIVKKATAEEIFEANKSNWIRTKEWLEKRFSKNKEKKEDLSSSSTETTNH